MSELASRAWTDVADRSYVLLVPLGSTEQHGPHLPLDTDTRIAVAVATEVASRLEDVVVAPALPFGASGEHAGFPGTISIGTEALHLVLVELVRSLGSEVDRTVLVNGHGGNVEAIGTAVDLLRTEGRTVEAWSPRVAGGDAHAGETETSLLLALDPSAVRLDRAEAGNVTPLASLLPELRRGGVAAVSPNGVLGDPSTASAERGRATLSALAADLEATVTRTAGGT
ncbi:MAG: mycofactocin biosynthesis peptidyl-dipeptidase MftE [Actinomycetota bacterium]